MRSAIARSLGGIGVVLVVALHARLAIGNPQARPHTPAGASGPPAASGNSPATRPLPDIVGFRPGISLQEATRLLKAYDPKGTIQVGQVQMPETNYKPIPVTLLFKSATLRGLEAPEMIQLELTLPPEKPVVWGILRRLVFEAGKERNRTTLIAELRQKYGPEGNGLTTPIVNLYWVFDEQGRRAETGGAAFSNCALPGAWDVTLDRSGVGARSSTFSGYSLLLGRPVPNQGPCKPLVYVRAFSQPSAGHGFELIESTQVAVIDAALAARAQAATAAYRARPR
jgi:hypothetical protein